MRGPLETESDISSRTGPATCPHTFRCCCYYSAAAAAAATAIAITSATAAATAIATATAAVSRLRTGMLYRRMAQRV